MRPTLGSVPNNDSQQWAAGRTSDASSARRVEARQLLGPEKRKKLLAAIALKKIQALYRIERDIMAMVPQEQHRIRALRPNPLLGELGTWLDQHVPIVPPCTALHKAMHYTDKQ